MSRRTWILLSIAILVLCIPLALYRVATRQTTYLGDLREYAFSSQSSVMHNFMMTVVGATAIRPSSLYVRQTEVELKNISPAQATIILKRTCSAANGWSLRIGRHETAFFNKGEAHIAVSPSRYNDGSTVRVNEIVPIPKLEESMITFLSRFHIRLAR